jgi:hypothetical protein
VVVCQERGLVVRVPTYYSQVDQDRILNDAVFCGMRDGIFVDVGAHDGFYVKFKIVPLANLHIFPLSL